MFAYESLFTSATKLSPDYCENLIRHGWKLGDYPAVSLKRGELPWVFRGQQERSWNFHIHSWDMLDAILTTHSETKNVDLLQAAQEVALDWFNYLENAEELSPFTWYDMAVGLRAYRLAYLFEASEAAGILNEQDSAILWRGLEAHQKYLADDSNIVFHNNHGFYQAAGQLAMGRRFAQRSELMDQARIQGRERLRSMLKTQFAADGVHLEHSPDYHRMVYSTLRGVLDAGLIDDPDILAFADKIEEALYWFVQPNQRLANFGDSDYRSVAMSVKNASERWRTDPMRYAASGGQCGNSPREGLAAFEQGGYFVVKTPLAGEDSNPETWGYLAQQAAFHSRTHKHADTLSLVWHEHGHDILVDSGRYGYLGKAEQGSELWKDGHWYSDPKRVYCESTRAHNTVEFDNKNFPRKGIKPPGSLIGRHQSDSNGVYMLESEARHQRGLRHARVIFYQPGKWLIVFDWYKSNLGIKHVPRQWFHFAPELNAERKGAGYSVRIPDLDTPLKVQPLLPIKATLPVISGQTEPMMQGWWSGKERELIPADAVGFEISEGSEGWCATVFTFSHDLECDLSRSRVSKSGRKGTFFWTDDTGTHSLVFQRENNSGAFTFDYKTNAEPKGKLRSLIGSLFRKAPDLEINGPKERYIRGVGNIELLGAALRRATEEVPFFSSMEAPSLKASPYEILRCLSGFPITNKSDLRSNIQDFLSRRFDVEKLVVASSSGSTGVPLEIYRDKSEYTIELDFIHKAWAQLGIEPGDKTAVFRTGYDERQGEGIGFVDNRGTFWIQLTDLSEENLAAVFAEIEAFSPKLMRGNGSLVAAFLRFCYQTGRDVSWLKGVGYSSDEMFPEERKLIRETLGLGLVSLWGQTERAAMAVTTPFKDGFLVCEDYGYVELVRSDGSLITAPGEYGQIVGTSLFPRATGMIRYATGDYASWSPQGELTNIAGRGTAVMIARSGHQYHIPISFRENVLAAVPVDTSVQFLQRKPGELVLKVNKPKRKDMDSLISEFGKLGDIFDVDIEWSAELSELPSGKRQLYCIESSD